MQEIINFISDLETLVLKIFELVDLIMGKVEEYTAEEEAA